MYLQNTFFYIIGIVFLALAKAKNILQGYSSPKPFDISETERCIDYDIRAVEQWLSCLSKYTHDHNRLEGKKLLELGPGSDLGIGIYLLSMGCAEYNACDVNDLMKTTPVSFYENLLRRINAMNSQANIDFLKEQLDRAKAGKPSKLNYVVRDDFDLVSAFGVNTIDLVFSKAAFEHFDDVDATISQLSTVCKPGAVIVAQIDLKTHSRWIRDKDPNNIYRYSSNFYKKFWFQGIPNRVRPFQYKEAFERHGWIDISIVPHSKLENHKRSYRIVNKAFIDEKNQMDYLTIMLCARKAKSLINSNDEIACH
jgi:SAM-dependent methyltransferase